MLNRQLLEDVRDLYQLQDIEFVNKDFYVVEVLKTFTTLKIESCDFVFGGGTCLTKAFNLTHRMSEDVDLRIMLNEPPVSKSSLKKRLSDIKHQVENYLAITFPGSFLIKAGNGNRYLDFNIVYPRVSSSSALREGIKVELSYFPLLRPPESKAISSFITQAQKKKPDIPHILCVSPIETLVDKMVALPRRICAAKEKNEPLDRNTIRHVYDIFTIYKGIETDQIPMLIKTAIRQEQEEYSGNNPEWTANPIANTKLALEELKEPKYAQMFAQYASAMIYERNMPDYKTMIGFVFEKILLAFES
jgi:predicted nucleotidyltransferase component of viral defense system